MRRLRRAAVLAIVAYGLLVLTVFVNQRGMMFLPATNRVYPADIGLSGVEEVVLGAARGERLYSWYGEADPGRPTVLFFHGNAGSVSHRRHRFREYAAAGLGLFMLGYPGYGGSEGSPSERAFDEAAQLAYDFLRADGVAADDIVIYGESIGTGVAVTLAARNPARALVLEAPMSSATDVAAALYPYLPVRLLIRDPFESIERIGHVGMPLLIVHGDKDRIIGIEHGRRLFERASEPKVFYRVSGAGHNNLGDFPVLEEVEKFISSR